NRGRGLREVVNRQKPVYISRGYIDSDELVYSLPAGYRLESRPSDQRLKTDFGEFSAEISLTDNTLVYKRRLRLNEGVYPAETYAKLVGFYQRVYESDRTNLILIRNK